MVQVFVWFKFIEYGYSLGSSTFLQRALFHSFLWLNSIPSYLYTSSFPIHIWVVFNRFIFLTLLCRGVFGPSSPACNYQHHLFKNLSLLSHTVKKHTEVNIPCHAKLENLQNAFKCIITFHSHSNLGTYYVHNKGSEKVR